MPWRGMATNRFVEGLSQQHSRTLLPLDTFPSNWSRNDVWIHQLHLFDTGIFLSPCYQRLRRRWSVGDGYLLLRQCRYVALHVDRSFGGTLIFALGLGDWATFDPFVLPRMLNKTLITCNSFADGRNDSFCRCSLTTKTKVIWFISITRRAKWQSWREINYGLNRKWSSMLDVNYPKSTNFDRMGNSIDISMRSTVISITNIVERWEERYFFLPK